MRLQKEKSEGKGHRRDFASRKRRGGRGGKGRVPNELPPLEPGTQAPRVCIAEKRKKTREEYRVAIQKKKKKGFTHRYTKIERTVFIPEIRSPRGKGVRATSNLNKVQKFS